MPCPNYANLIDSDRKRVDIAFRELQVRLYETHDLRTTPHPRDAERSQHDFLCCQVEFLDELKELLACKVKAGRMNFVLTELQKPKAQRLGRYKKMKGRVVASIPQSFSPFIGGLRGHGVKLVSWGK